MKLNAIILVVALPATSVLAAPPAERTMKVTGKLLLVPVGKKPISRSYNRWLTIKVGDILVHKLQGDIVGDKSAIQWWGYLDMSEYVGRTAKISIEGKDINSRTLSLLEFSDKRRNLLPLYREKTRPQFHFSQMQGWNNDPNGMLYLDGTYHMFFQSNPLGKNWGNMYWGHATSKDLVYWTEHKRALRTFGGKTPLAKRHPSMSVASSFSGGGNVDHTNAAGETRCVFVAKDAYCPGGSPRHTGQSGAEMGIAEKDSGLP